MQFELTYGEIVVLHELLHRWEDDGTIDRLPYLDPAERTAMWNLSAAEKDGVMSNAQRQRNRRRIAAMLLSGLLAHACGDERNPEHSGLPRELEACDSGSTVTEFRAEPGGERSGTFELPNGPIALSVRGRGSIGSKAELTAADGRVVMSSQVTTLQDRSCVSATVPAGEYVVVVTPPSQGGADWSADVVITHSVR